jgi:signal peptidase I
MTDWDSSIGREVYFVLLALILAFGILQTTGTVLETERPVVSVVSCSMYPEYDRGDILVVDGVDFSTIDEGDVIIFNVPMESAVRIDGEEYSLGEELTDTSLGPAKITTVEENQAIIEIDGQRIRVSSGGTYQVSDSNLEVVNVSGVNIPVVHRVTEKRNDSLETKGDNNPQQLDFEKDISPEQVYGKVFFRIPKIGAVKLIAMDLAGLTGDPLTIDTYSGCR